MANNITSWRTVGAKIGEWKDISWWREMKKMRVELHQMLPFLFDYLKYSTFYVTDRFDSFKVIFLFLFVFLFFPFNSNGWTSAPLKILFLWNCLWDIWYIQIADIGKAKLLQTHRDVTFKVQKNDINLTCLNNNLIVSKAAMTMYSLDDRKSRTSGWTPFASPISSCLPNGP